MALIEHCMCCNLLTATALTGIYSLVAYVIAIVLELWWMIQDEDEVPAAAYLLCFGHFVLLCLSGLLLIGAATKKSQWLLIWTAAVGTWWIPEAALAIYMSLHHWHLDTPQGMTELLLWISRALLNVAGIICVASLYAGWREEKMVMRRLQDLNMQAAILMESGNSRSNGHQSKMNGYHNAGFVETSPSVSSEILENKVPLAAVENLVGGKLRRNHGCLNLGKVPLENIVGGKIRRSSSACSPGSNMYRGRVATPAFASPPNGRPFHPAVHFVSSYEKASRGLSSNEFNASAFMQQSPNNAALQRARSLLELQIAKHDHWRSPVRPTPTGYIDFVPGSEMATQSLDRRRSPRRPSQQHQGHQRSSNFGTLPRSFRVERDPSPRVSSNHSSKTSLASQQSDEMQRYRDIAL